jgi:hypothetical protein|eukprot:COSAG06_NODE_2712_length_6404_cov_132.465821_1_plen_220_part_00
MARGNDLALAICAAPDSTLKYPNLPNCTLTPKAWTPPICGQANSWWCNQTADGKCPDPQNPHICPGHGPPPKPPPHGNSGCHQPTHPVAPVPPSPPMPKADFVGCFKDKTPHGQCDLPYVINGGCANAEGHLPCFPGVMTPQTCNALCLRAIDANSSLGLKYFANQAGHACFCGVSYGSQGAAPAGDCNVSCTGDSKQVCGGMDRNSVWKIRPAKPSAQ